MDASKVNLEKNLHKGVQRITGILEFVASKKNGCTFSDLVNGLKMPKSTLFPLVHTLKHFSYLSFNESTGRYHLGIQIYDLGSKYLNNIDYLDFIKTGMVEISFETGESCNFGILIDGNVYYVLKENSPRSLRMVTMVGDTLPAYSTGIGKALLSQFTKIEDLRRIYPNGLKKILPATISDYQTLFEQIVEIQDRGFATEREESTEHITCVAVPIQLKGKVVAALSIATPVFRFDDEIKEKQKAILFRHKESIEDHLKDIPTENLIFEAKPHWRNDEE